MEQKNREAIATNAFRRMVESESFFTICPLNEVAKIIGVRSYVSDEYNALGALHCIHWHSIGTEIKAAIPSLFEAIVKDGREGHYRAIFERARRSPWRKLADRLRGKG